MIVIGQLNKANELHGIGKKITHGIIYEGEF